MIKKNFIALVALLLVLGGGSLSAASLNWSADQTVYIVDADTDLTVVSGSTASTLVVASDSIVVTLEEGDVFTVNAEVALEVTGETTSVVEESCEADVATVEITGGQDEEEITITPGEVVCESEEEESSGGTSSSGSVSRRAAPATPATPAVTAPADCLPGFLFSPSTGKSCSAATPTTPATPAAGQGNAYVFGTTTIKQGSTGEACKAWQMFFNDKFGAKLATDGICGPLTMAVAKAWQASVGLVADGLLGPMSRAKAMAQ
ncbi:MAG: hypothetical protein M3M85_02875 [bacterium]|nr:hypothetical protein [bacterium]